MSAITQNEIRTYYSQYFPSATIREWLQYNVSGEAQEPEANREWAGYFDEGHFVRWCTIEQMMKLVNSAKPGPPDRIEIGPVYSHRIADHKNVPGDKFKAVHRELVFDIDADDFKDIKCCCGPSEICPLCWPYMHCALDCLITILTRNFGFQHILPVFSGRRGVHIWVCDKRARELSREVREKIVQYLNIRKTMTNGTPLNSCPLAVSIIELCDGYFGREIIETQRVFEEPKLREILSPILPDDWFLAIMDRWEHLDGESQEKWESVKGMTLPDGGKRRFQDTPA
jgi:DNA primase small subunit